jgi:pimeloyl-ACP methyl ester carboxylesterase
MGDDTDVRYVDVGGVSIAYRRMGSGPAVLLSHGFTASSHMFLANARLLAHDHTVILWDNRGHGASDSPEDQSQYSQEQAVADMAAVLDANGVDRAVVAGHSLGGFLSLAFHLAHPERVRALIPIDTGPGYRNDEARAGWNRYAIGFAEQFEQHGFEGYGGGTEFDPSVHRHGPAGIARAARGILTQQDGRVLASLPSIAVPTMVIVGELDTPFVNGSHYMAGKIPGAELVIIPGAGHSPNLSHPDAFDAAMRSFLDRLT